MANNRFVQLKDGRLLLLWSEFIRTDLMPEGERPPDSPLRRDLVQACVPITWFYHD